MTDKFCELGKEEMRVKDIMSINKEKLRPIVRDISTTPRSYILEDEDVTISFSLERKKESIKKILNNEGNE